MINLRLRGNLMAMSGFKNFIMRGNLVELAVAVVIGTQFSNLVKQFVSSFVNPLLSLVGGTPNFGNLVWKVGKVRFTYGAFLTDVLTFLISALAVYYVMVLPVSRLLHMLERNKAAATRDCPECTMSIPIAAQRCPQCTAQIAPGHPAAAAGQPDRVLARRRKSCPGHRSRTRRPTRSSATRAKARRSRPGSPTRRRTARVARSDVGAAGVAHTTTGASRTWLNGPGRSA
jgi:large conductance mechanosensitive channel